MKTQLLSLSFNNYDFLSRKIPSKDQVLFLFKYEQVNKLSLIYFCKLVGAEILKQETVVNTVF